MNEEWEGRTEKVGHDEHTNQGLEPRALMDFGHLFLQPIEVTEFFPRPQTISMSSWERPSQIAVTTPRTGRSRRVTFNKDGLQVHLGISRRKSERCHRRGRGRSTPCQHLRL